MTSSNRLISLDVLRGLTVAMMILVNNGVGHDQFTQLMHSKWNGLTICDLVFPFFLFMVGVSIAISMTKYGPDARTLNPSSSTGQRKDIIRKVLVRALKMFLIGVLLHAWDMWIGGKDDILANLRIWGVLQRIALCYCAVSFIVLFVRARYYWFIITAIILIYAATLHFGNGYLQDESNILCVADRALFGAAHLYHKSPIDPEGLLGTIPSIAHTLIGVVVGSIMRQKSALSHRLKSIGIVALLLIVSGCIISIVMPFNKRIWSPSYVLATTGIATLMLTLLTYLIDILGRRADGTSRLRWYQPFQWFGMNAIVLYVASEMLAPVMGSLEAGKRMYGALTQVGFSTQWASLSYALSFLFVMTLLAFVMYKRKIFIKL